MRYNRLNPLHWLLALFSNSRKTDYLGGVPGYRPGDYAATRRIMYWLRNPCHDFTSYIIGFVGDPRFKTVSGNAVDSHGQGWLFAVRGWRWLRLPFVSYGGKILFYAGWRPSGDFGLKLRRAA